MYRTEVAKASECPPPTPAAAEATTGYNGGTTTLEYVDVPVSCNGGVCPDDETRRVRSADRMAAEDLLVYPLASINRVRWNSNRGSHFTLASGGQAGIVRIHTLEGLQSKEVKREMDKVEEVV